MVPEVGKRYRMAIKYGRRTLERHFLVLELITSSSGKILGVVTEYDGKKIEVPISQVQA